MKLHRPVRRMLDRATVLSSACAVSLLAAAALPAQEASEALEDADIVSALEGELQRASAVPLRELDVTCASGIVTLEGEVDNVLAQDRAVRIARMTRGVRSVVERIDVDPGFRSDEDVLRDVEAALLSDPATSSWQVAASVEEGVVTLTGSVDSWAEKQLAAKVAKGVTGVVDLDNRLDVSYETDRDDTEIQHEIEGKLGWDTRVDAQLVQVKVEGGAVHLSGFVGSDFERERARANAWVSGVHSVDDSDLSVRWWARDEMIRKDMWNRSDDEIRAAVEAAMRFDPRVLSFRPEVRVRDGVVTLRGTVGNLKARRAAAQDAQNTVGVLRVKNLLKVRSKADLTDEEIEREIRDALDRDAMVQADEVRVVVEDGEARLYGTVDSYFERAQADDAAARAPGVLEVRNHLRVDYVSPYPYDDYYYYDWDPLAYDFHHETVRTKPDWEIQDDIEGQLYWSPFVDANEVSVTVEDGVATLDGTVDSWSERRAAAENALEGGAFKVINELDIDYGIEAGSQ